MRRANRHDNWKHTKWQQPYQSAWKAATKLGDAFNLGGPATKLSPRSLWNNEMAFGRYHEFMLQNGLLDGGSVVAIAKLRAFSIHLSQSVSPYSVLAHFSQVVAAVRLMYPDADLRDANAAISRFAGEVRPVRSIEDRLCNPVELIAIGKSMMAEAEAKAVHGKSAARQFRTGALIMAAALCPLRHRNWRMMVIGQHLDLESGRVFFKATEMKRKREMEFHLPPELLQPLRRYVDHYRPLLLRSGSQDEGHLWPSPTGGMTHRNALGIAVKQAVLKRTGKAFNFHLFRHACATFISEIAPERTRIASGVLHHGRLSTTNKYYIKGQKRLAFRRYHKAVRDLVAKAQSRIARRAKKKR